MEKIKLAYLVSSLANEGPVNVIYNIVKHIDFNCFDVTIITIIPEREKSRLQDFERFPVTIHQLSPVKRRIPIAIYFDLLKMIEDYRYCIIHAHCARSLYYLGLLRIQSKKVYTAHCYPGVQECVKFGKTKGVIISRLSRFFIKKMDLPIACSNSVGGQFKDELGWDIGAIPNGGSFDLWSRCEKEKAECRRELGLDGDKKYLIFVGRFSAEKNPELLIKSFLELNLPNISLLMLGDGPLFDKLKDAKLDNIHIIGFTNQVLKYLKSADYYISTSSIEGLANTLLESMAVGLPMVLSDIPSHKEIMQTAGVEIGIIYNLENTVDLCDAINKILTMNYNELSKNVQSAYDKNYTSLIMSKNYQVQYGYLIKNYHENNLQSTFFSS